MAGSELDRVMREQGRKGRWLADLTGVSPGLVSFWRHGHRTVPHAKRPLIAAALGRTEASLWPDQPSASQQTGEQAA